MFCANCGNPMKKEQKFCAGCGAGVAVNNRVAGTVPASVAQKKSDNRRPLIVGVAVLAVIVLLVVNFAGGGEEAALRQRRAEIEPFQSLIANSFIIAGVRGNGSVITVRGPQDSHEWRDVIAVSARGYILKGIMADGTVAVAGLPDASIDRYRHVNVARERTAEWRNIVAVTPSAGLRSNGRVLSEQWEEAGRWRNIVAISCSEHHLLGLRSNGRVVAAGGMGHGDSDPLDVGRWRNIVAISTNSNHSIGLRSDGTVVSAGLNTSGMRNVDDWQNIVAVSAGQFHTVGLRADGTVVAVGRNNSGQLDVAGWRDIVAVSAGSSGTIGLRADGSVVGAGQFGFFEDIDRAVRDWQLFDHTTTVVSDTNTTVAICRFCPEPALRDRDYCPMHACTYGDCRQGAPGMSPFCDDHTCRVPYCWYSTIPGGRYCPGHM